MSNLYFNFKSHPFDDLNKFIKRNQLDVVKEVLDSIYNDSSFTKDFETNIFSSFISTTLHSEICDPILAYYTKKYVHNINFLFNLLYKITPNKKIKINTYQTILDNVPFPLINTKDWNNVSLNFHLTKSIINIDDSFPLIVKYQLMDSLMNADFHELFQDVCNKNNITVFNALFKEYNYHAISSYLKLVKEESLSPIMQQTFYTTYTEMNSKIKLFIHNKINSMQQTSSLNNLVGDTNPSLITFKSNLDNLDLYRKLNNQKVTNSSDKSKLKI